MVNNGPALLLDENIGVVVKNTLTEHGCNVKSIITDVPGINDEEVLQMAREEQRILVTLDKDFGLLVCRRQKEHRGVVLLRLSDERPALISRTLLYILETYGEKLSDRFSVVTDTQIKIR